MSVAIATPVTIMSQAAATGAGTIYGRGPAIKTFQIVGATSSGAGGATVKIQGSNDKSTWVDLGTVTLTLATTASADGFVVDAPWVFSRANVTAISGTGAYASVFMGAVGGYGA